MPQRAAAPGVASGEGSGSALAGYKHDQFHRELRLKRVALAATNEATRSVAPLPSTEKLKAQTRAMS